MQDPKSAGASGHPPKTCFTTWKGAGRWAQDGGGRRAGPSHAVLLYDTTDVEMREAGRSEVSEWDIGGRRMGGLKSVNGRSEGGEWEVCSQQMGCRRAVSGRFGWKIGSQKMIDGGIGTD